MCRLALFNRQALALLEQWSALEYILTHLECSFGGHGNGVAALWSETGQVKMRKGVKMSTERASRTLSRYAEQGADWMLFHTRRASSSVIADEHCHPFRVGKLTLAQNGHDTNFAFLGRAVGITDTECIAKTWSRLNIPLAALDKRSGVFIGFQHNTPFVVKGSLHSDLVAAWHKETGAVLFASEIPACLVQEVFGQAVEVRRMIWFGQELEEATLDVRPYQPHVQEQSLHISAASYWEDAARESLDLANLAEEAGALYDPRDEDGDEEDDLRSAWVSEHRWTNWQQGKMVDDEAPFSHR